MNQLEKIFNYQGTQLRTVVLNNEPWFVAKDVCNILKHSNSRVAISRLDDDEKGVSKVYTPGGYQNMSVVNEYGLYNLVLTSNLPEAKQFKRWITHEVIPSIRKHGAYMTPEKIEEVLLNPDTLIKLATNLKEEQQKRIAAEKQIEQQKPLVNFAETCMASDKSLLVREVAKMISKQGILMGERRLFQKLRDWKLIFPNKNEPYQEYIDRGYFEISQGVKETSKGSFTWLTMRVTPKGQMYIINRLKKEQQKEAI
ncbi:phage antirepressor [Caldibacillus thermolactis]|jgi:anti-repressor protein|uniref:Phage antirepressor n=1 Tax=Pallidibacillus thermolactis TaxID=251051 RepID=A0ABT2WIS6_9BACI|nr:phage antirepressor [Pallidibacillus thermolactis]MCU9594599.1 phage antirepressor [Pallidibacillus thermolactis]